MLGAAFKLSVKSRPTWTQYLKRKLSSKSKKLIQKALSWHQVDQGVWVFVVQVEETLELRAVVEVTNDQKDLLKLRYKNLVLHHVHLPINVYLPLDDKQLVTYIKMLTEETSMKLQQTNESNHLCKLMTSADNLWKNSLFCTK